MSGVLTYSALNAFRNCPRKYKHRHIGHLGPVERPEALAFGSVNRSEDQQRQSAHVPESLELARAGGHQCPLS